MKFGGAQGGEGYYQNLHPGGLGGYSVGTLNLVNNTSLYVYIGQEGKTGNSVHNVGSSFNGGGTGGAWPSSGYSSTIRGGGGGGATDIALYGTNGSSNWNNTNHLYSRIIVAGGGGGGGETGTAGAGGGTSGLVGNSGGGRNTDWHWFN